MTIWGGSGNASLVLTINPEPPPRLEALLNPLGVDLSFLTLVNRRYTVEWVDSLLTSNWTELVSGIVGDGTTRTVTDTITNTPSRFYRLKVTAP